LVAIGCSTTPSTESNGPASSGGGGASAAPTADIAASASPSLDELSLDELAELAMAEGGTINWYATVNERDSGLLREAFEAQYPGMRINHVHAGTEDLVARAISEAAGGRVLADVYQLNLVGTDTLRDQGLLLDGWIPPETEDWPETLRGDFWFTAEQNFYIIAWNKDQVPDAEAPQLFTDLIDPKWKGKLISDSTDVRMIVGLAKRKFASEAEATSWLEGVAANDVQFHSGASNMRALIESGQAAVCFSCLAQHYPPIIEAGAPVNFSREEGVADLSMNTISEGAPHPISAKLLSRWMADADGGAAVFAINSTPGNPAVEPQNDLRPDNAYPILLEDLEDWDHYTEVWNAVFGLRG
jgi:iron(III) transport system substrate-binding protein